MQSDRPPFDSSYPRDPRSIHPRRISHYNSQVKRSQSVDSEGSQAKRKEADEEDSDSESRSFDKLKKFHIPRKKGQEEKELLTEVPLTAREYTRMIYPIFRSSFFDAQSSRKLLINQVELVQNCRLEREYLAKKKDLKDEGRLEKELGDSFGYVHFFKRSEVEKVCREGLSIGHCNVASLGKPEMGVYISKHADVVRFSKWEDQQSGYIVMFKVVKGKTKVVTEGRTPMTDQEPTPLYDCHITKIPINIAQSVHKRAYFALQYYFYEYGDTDVVQRPRQVVPYAVLKYTYKENANTVVAGSHTTRRESSLEETFSDAGTFASTTAAVSSENGFCHWRGKLLVKNGTFCSVEMLSHLDTVFNVANIDRTINVKMCLSLDKLKRQLPPTLMSRSAKKYNVIYRGHTYNTFTLHPTEEGSGLGKFRQLISHLVQRSTAAFMQLRNNSSLYLLPMSGLTEEMGLRTWLTEPPMVLGGGKQSQRAWKNFLHVIIITPKALSSKINDQRVHNVIRNRKRKEAPLTAVSSVRDALEQKLRQMNIDPSFALSSADPNQHEKIYNRLKDKKKLLASEKLLHSHYREVDALPSKTKAVYIESLMTRWKTVAKLQQEMYSTKKKLKVIQSPPNMRQRNITKSSTENAADIPMEDVEEATFSDDDCVASNTPTNYKIPKRQKMEVSVKVASPANTPFVAGKTAFSPRGAHLYSSERPRIPQTTFASSSTPAVGTSALTVRPSFKALEELVFSGNLEELLKHPEFNFTEKHCATHRVIGFGNSFCIDSPYVPWDESHPRISITFNQSLPYPGSSADCPFAFNNEEVILSMLRAIHGNYDGSSDTPQDYEKVHWVRKVLHDNSSTPKNLDELTAHAVPRKIVDFTQDKPIQEASPRQSSTDSGFATPGNMSIPDSPSLKDIAAFIASALTQTKATETTSDDADLPASSQQEDISPDMELATKALLEAITQHAGSESDNTNLDDLVGVDMDLGSPLDQSPVKERSGLLDPRLASNTHLGDEGTKATPAFSGDTTLIRHSQGSESLRTDPSLRPPFHLPSQSRRVKIPQEEVTLAALRKAVPGLTKEKLVDVLTRVTPVVTKMIAKMKSRGENPKPEAKIGTSTATPASDRSTKDEGEKVKDVIPTKPGIMTITLTTGQNAAAVVGDVPKDGALKSNMTYIPGLDIVSAEGPAPSQEILTTKNPVKIACQTEIESGKRNPAGIQLLENADPGCSATVLPTTVGIKRTMLKKSTLIPSGDQLSSVMPQTTTAQTLPLISVGTNRLLRKDPSSKAQSAAPIGTIITQRHYRAKFRRADQGALTQISPVRPSLGLLSQADPVPSSRGPYYPIPPPHHYLGPALTAAYTLTYPAQTYIPVGGGSLPTYPPNPSAISQHNTELLRAILTVIQSQQDPRLKTTVDPRKMVEQNLYANILPSTVVSNPNTSGPHVGITPFAQTLAPVPKTESGAPGGKLPSHPGLSYQDILRIREKKEREKERREMAKREAISMREALNKNIERLKPKHPSKKSKPTDPAKPKVSTSPDGASSNARASQFSLSQSASTKVLKDVALALLKTNPGAPSLPTTEPGEPSSQTPSSSTKPTGVVTPTPRSSHPVFMQSPNTFPLTEVTSSPQGATPTTASVSGGHDPTSVISDIDATLSQLKQGLQGSGDRDELKESMAKLLQLVLKLGGTSSTNAPPASSARSSAIPVSADNDGDLRDTLNAATRDSNDGDLQDGLDATTRDRNNGDLRDTLNAATRPLSPTVTAQSATASPSGLVTRAVEDKASAYRWSLENISDEKLPSTGNVCVLERAGSGSLSPAVSVEREKIVREYENRSAETSDVAATQPELNIDEILTKLKPYIEDLQQNQNEKIYPKEEVVKSESSTIADESTPVVESPVALQQSFDSDAATESRHSPATFTSQPNPSAAMARPRPTHQTVVDVMPTHAAGVHPIPVHPQTLLQDRIAPISQESHQKVTVVATSVSCGTSDRGTPTMDERYPDFMRRKRKRASKSQCNSFFVFDPENSSECEAIRRYLTSVKGTRVNIESMVKEFLSRMMVPGADPAVLEKEFRSVMPPGTLWVVFRTADMRLFHSTPHLALLKAAGSLVQFVAADSVQDVREGKYKIVMPGDVGVMVPLCPKTLLSNPATFRSLMLWLVGQSNTGKVRNEWRLALHQHMLDAVQDAENSDDPAQQRNADQVLDWLCHIGETQTRLAIELPEHECDRVETTSGRAQPNAWKWYDTASDEEIAACALPCAIKLQSDRVRQSRHVVLLIDGDPGALCWKPVWQSGVCVTTMERFVDLVGGKPSDSAAQQLTSCVLPLYGCALQCL